LKGGSPRGDRRAQSGQDTEMPSKPSPRLLAIVDALPLSVGLRVLEIGCGPGAMAREIARRIGDGHVLAIDRSAKVIAQARTLSQEEIAAGRLSLRHVAAEDFVLQPGEARYDIAVAVRALHPEAGRKAKRRIAAALTPEGRLFIDGDDALEEVTLGEMIGPSRCYRFLRT
jgi:cyclopropane fatty-acyl-phospholipid synthase-like methyltransferase